MTYNKQAATLCALILFLQASTCWHTKSKNASTPISPEVPDKKLALEDPKKGHYTSDFDPEFDPEFDPNCDPDFAPNVNAGYKIDEASNAHAKSGYDSGYDSDADAKPVPTQQPLRSSDPAKNNLDFDFENWIKKMRETADANRKIKWCLSGDTLTRVVENSRSSNMLYAPEDYIVQGLNIYRAAKKICALHGQGGSVFAKKAYAFVNYYYACSEKPEDFWIETIKKINKAVVLHLQRRCFNDENTHSINEKLRLAENYVGLDDTHYNVTTTFTIEGKKFALEDKKWLTLTEKQERAYLNRKSEKWYTRLRVFEQKFIDAYVDKLLDGQHYIPTQLRSIPGCRNAYQKRILAYDENNNPTPLGSYYHSGSLVSPIEWSDKATDFQITKDNWEQITNQAKNVEVISLNYNMDLLGSKQLREKKIVEDTKEVVGDERFMNLSINRIGTSFNLNHQYNKLVQATIALYGNKYPDLCSAFNNTPEDKRPYNAFYSLFKKDPKKDRNKQIDAIKDPKDKRFFKQLEALEEAAQGGLILNNLKQATSIIDNPNATAGANYIACKSSLTATPSDASILFSCKSGKDRTGLMSYLVDGNLIHMNHPSLSVMENSTVYATLSYAGHYQFLASVNGGMPGRFGMKSVQANLISRKYTEPLFPRAAKLTHIDLIKKQVESIDQ